MTDRPLIEHAPRCQRRRPPMLRLSWDRRPELICGECGRTRLVDDIRPTNPKETRP